MVDLRVCVCVCVRERERECCLDFFFFFFCVARKANPECRISSKLNLVSLNTSEKEKIKSNSKKKTNKQTNKQTNKRKERRKKQWILNHWSLILLMEITTVLACIWLFFSVTFVLHSLTHSLPLTHSLSLCPFFLWTRKRWVATGQFSVKYERIWLLGNRDQRVRNTCTLLLDSERACHKHEPSQIQSDAALWRLKAVMVCTIVFQWSQSQQ